MPQVNIPTDKVKSKYKNDVCIISNIRLMSHITWTKYLYSLLPDKFDVANQHVSRMSSPIQINVYLWSICRNCKWFGQPCHREDEKRFIPTIFKICIVSVGTQKKTTYTIPLSMKSNSRYYCDVCKRTRLRIEHLKSTWRHTVRNLLIEFFIN